MVRISYKQCLLLAMSVGRSFALFGLDMQNLQSAARPALMISSFKPIATQRPALITMHPAIAPTSASKKRIGLKTVAKSTITQATSTPTLDSSSYQMTFAGAFTNMTLLPQQIARQQYGAITPLISTLHTSFGLLVKELRSQTVLGANSSRSEEYVRDGNSMFKSYSNVVSYIMDYQSFLLTRPDYYPQFLQLNRDMSQYIEVLQNFTTASDQNSYVAMIKSINTFAEDSALAIQDYQLNSYNFTVTVVGGLYGKEGVDTYFGLRFGDNYNVGVVGSPEPFRIVGGFLQTSGDGTKVYTYSDGHGHDHYHDTVSLRALLLSDSGNVLKVHETWAIVNNTLTSTQSGALATIYECSFPPAPLVFKATIKGPSDLDAPNGGCYPVTLHITRT